MRSRICLPRSEWKEEQRTEWLLSELTGKRPLLPPGLQCTPEVAEVLSTFRILAELPPDSLGAYVISMAHTASDVLAVVLLQVQRCLLHLQICVHAPACQPSLQTHFATALFRRHPANPALPCAACTGSCHRIDNVVEAWQSQEAPGAACAAPCSLVLTRSAPAPWICPCHAKLQRMRA